MVGVEGDGDLTTFRLSCKFTFFSKTGDPLESWSEALDHPEALSIAVKLQSRDSRKYPEGQKVLVQRH